MTARAPLFHAVLVAMALALSACAECLDMDPPQTCPHPAPLVLHQDGPFNGGGNGM
ncbi:MAG: hypothetical protein WCC64_11590 [Aliidongia sp.]